MATATTQQDEAQEIDRAQAQGFTVDSLIDQTVLGRPFGVRDSQISRYLFEAPLIFELRNVQALDSDFLESRWRTVMVFLDEFARQDDVLGRLLSAFLADARKEEPNIQEDYY